MPSARPPNTEPRLAATAHGANEPAASEAQQPQEAGFGPPAGSTDPFGMVNLSGPPSDASGASEQLRLDDVRVQGPQSPEVVTRILRQLYGRYRACCQRAFGTHARAQAALELLFDISAGGRVANARLGESSPREPKLAKCWLHELQGSAFPAAEGASSVQFRPTFARSQPNAATRK